MSRDIGWALQKLKRETCVQLLDCPLCKQPPGRKCRNPNGSQFSYQPHRSRLLALAQMRHLVDGLEALCASS